jgi:hypothetical protein
MDQVLLLATHERALLVDFDVAWVLSAARRFDEQALLIQHRKASV